MNTYGKFSNKQCQICGSRATTVYYDQPMCFKCASQSAKYARKAMAYTREEAVTEGDT